ncbi:carboxypeptidase-like regulatory domain-containing protein [Kordia sp.]|uniref:carboxypeptidase-like regulatory domain-containing protein n=1 Tax=Kordia sp. TaxID=1965332 RepID=UPI00344B76B3
MIKQQEKGTITNEYVFFSLTLLEGQHTLIISYLGYQNITKEINLTSKTLKNLLEYKNGADLFLNENLEIQLLPAKEYVYGFS